MEDEEGAEAAAVEVGKVEANGRIQWYTHMEEREEWENGNKFT